MSESFNSRNGLLNLQGDQANGSYQDLGVSFGGRMQGTSFGADNVYYPSQFVISQEPYRSSVGYEDQSAHYDYMGEVPKGLLFRSSGEQFEMQFDDIRMDRLNIGMPMKIEEDLSENKRSFMEESRSIHSGSYDPDIKIESSEQISNKFKPEVKINQQLISDNKNLFNVNQAKSIYTNKITQLVDQVQSKVAISPKISPRQSKSQQKLMRKSSNNMRDHSDLSSNDIQQSSQHSGGDHSQDPVQQKLAKNRESARNSRARKKIYYELLETKVNEMQEEIDRLREQLKNYTKSVDIQSKSHEKFQQFLEQQQLLFDKLETSILKNKDNFEVGMILDALRYRTNSNSQERNDAARAHFDAIVEVCLPIQTKYLLYALDRNKDFFANTQEDYTEWMKEPFQKTEIRPDQINKVKKMRTKLQGVKVNISESIHKIKEQLKLIQSEAGKVDLMWESVKECLTPTQLGSCILAMRLNSFRNELQTSTLFTDLKNSKMAEEEDDQYNMHVEEQNPSVSARKLVKKQS